VLDPESPEELTDELAEPVFVDPFGRRRRALRIVAAATAVVTVGYLTLILLAVFGAPLVPAARLPVAPQVGSEAASETTTTSQTGLPLVGGPITESTEGSSTTTTTPKPTSAAPSPTPPTTSTTTTRKPKPTEPPGQGKPPTTPPGRG
jgi:cytoskeletal protein RodZ